MKKNILLVLILADAGRLFGQAVRCDNWLSTPSLSSRVVLGDLDVPGNQITVEAMINRTTPYTPGNLDAGDIVSKHLDPTNVNYLLRCDIACITTDQGFFITPTACPMQLNRTYHVAMVYDGSTLKFYRDGILLSQVAAAGNLFQSDILATIGLFTSPAWPEQFVGYINEVRIWNVARTQAQLQAYMNSSLPSPATQAGLLAYYTFDDLLNKQGNAAWNGGLQGNAAINAGNPTCAAFTPVNDCCAIITGSLAGNTICAGDYGMLTFHANTGTGPYTLTYEAGGVNYTQNNVLSDVAFVTQADPLNTTLYTLETIQDNSTICAPTAVTGTTGTITVKAGFSGDFTFDQDLCNPLQVTFSSSSTAGATYLWNIDGTDYPGSNVLPHTFSQFGNYSVRLTLSGTNICSGITTKNISVALGRSDLIPPGDTTLCAGQSLLLAARPSLGFCWSPAVYLDDPGSAAPTATPAVTTKYYFTAKVPGVNLIVNGDFSNGNTGFSSAYHYTSNNVTEGQYFVGGSPNNWNSGMAACGDHTTGSGTMMMLNGDPVAGANVWRQQVAIQPNTNYAFSTWIQSLYPPNPALLQFSINGVPLGNPVYASSSTCVWKQFYTIWNSGSNTTADISLVNQNTLVLGNDFALDDISFSPIQLLRDSVIITVVPIPVVTASADTSVCRGTSASLLAAGASTYSWSPVTGLSNTGIANPTATPHASTQYTVKGVDAQGCAASATVVVSLLDLPGPHITPDTSLCMGSQAQLYVSGGTVYDWSPAAGLDDPASDHPIATPAGNIRYMVQVTDNNHCTAIDSVMVSIRPRPVFHSPAARSICAGFSAKLGSGDAATYVYAWSPATYLDDPASSSPTVTPLQSLVYTLNVSDAACPDYDSSFQVAVDVIPSPEVVAQKANDIDCAVHSSLLTASGALDYTWEPVSGLSDAHSATPLASIDSTTRFIVKGTDNNGCYSFDTVTVAVKPTGANLFVLPNAFTPNGDGHNDCFGIRNWGDVKIGQFSIYDRWGMQVFSSRNPSDCWDGTYKGHPQPQGTYVFAIRGWSFCGPISQQGTLMLIR